MYTNRAYIFPKLLVFFGPSPSCLPFVFIFKFIIIIFNLLLLWLQSNWLPTGQTGRPTYELPELKLLEDGRKFGGGGGGAEQFIEILGVHVKFYHHFIVSL